MAKGFVRTPFEVKLLILYVLSGVQQPVDLDTLMDLVLCDDGVAYFDFSEALADLIRTEHVHAENGLHEITAKGRSNLASCISELAYSVRLICDRRVAELNETLRRERLVRAEVTPRIAGEGFTVAMALDDNNGNLLRVDMLAPTRQEADRLARNFKAHAPKVYNTLLSVLLEEQDGSDK